VQAPRRSATESELSRDDQRGVAQFLRAVGLCVGRAANRYPSAIAVSFLAISLWPLLAQQNLAASGDVGLYQAVSDDLFAGRVPYRDRELEYPPYAVVIFAAPRFFGRVYPECWIALAILCDGLIKYCLFAAGFLRPAGLRSFLPLLSYSVAVPFIGSFYFERYDIWPALICVMAILLFCSGRHALSGLAIALGAGLKVYPAIFIPVLAVIALRQSKAARFLIGLAGGLLPLALLSFVVPWWRFAQFQTARGLQVESLFASVLWLGKRLSIVDLRWEYTKKWFEVTGPSALVTLPWARATLVLAVVGATALAARVASRCHDVSTGQVATLLLVPLMAFVAFNTVLSPQFIIWALPLAALGTLEPRPLPILGILLAAALTPVFYPSLFGDYASGLNLFETSILVFRNLLLITTLGMLIRGLVRPARADQGAQPPPAAPSDLPKPIH